jgi:hypothetical protein
VKIFYTTVVVIAGCVVGYFLHPQSGTGRFQMCAGTIESVFANDNVDSIQKKPIILKIDTITGQTWCYADTEISSSNGVDFEQGWQKVTDYSYSTNYAKQIDFRPYATNRLDQFKRTNER